MVTINDTLFIIPARGGSKGLPRKNILPLNGQPLIYYSIHAARKVTSDENICVSTDDEEIIQKVEEIGLKVPFKRPKALASDLASSREVLLHAINYYQNNLGRNYSKVCLLQPTSPLRTGTHIKEAFKLWNDNIDMVVSVKESQCNPYYNLFEENSSGYLEKSKKSDIRRRQDAPKVWEFNGAIYIIALKKFMAVDMFDMKKIKYVMPDYSSIDIDTHIDFKIAELLIKENTNGELL
ncbi:cytidylyltransferase domain-containing protein [Prolixibacter denitrificans]|uniref:N-acylneuraminate cytidylyltransferase n=1 Tax=Prolixibacter denitrificans TaxID=1541063 RepID=A0A2P8C8Q4_9BACT|nr:acylneuraminate cytidylyltransferase family protein [Prolixibacter denitrificans]PSK81337.1 N-acylneuraminate cytidylyltransferase [Prolixibacter denitrificans]GET21578.1 hypothetical protein JCM18694_18240 [Prolixibacter denitrificans]